MASDEGSPPDFDVWTVMDEYDPAFDGPEAPDGT